MATLTERPLSTEHYTTELKTSRRASDGLFQAGGWVRCALLEGHELTGCNLWIQGRRVGECSATIVAAGLGVLVHGGGSWQGKVGRRNEIRILYWTIRNGVWCCGQQQEEAALSSEALVESWRNWADGGTGVRPRSEANSQHFSWEWAVLTGCEVQCHLLQRAAQNIPGSEASEHRALFLKGLYAQVWRGSVPGSQAP